MVYGTGLGNTSFVTGITIGCLLSGTVLMFCGFESFNIPMNSTIISFILHEEHSSTER